MVLATSALVAILDPEEDAGPFAAAISAAEIRRVSAATVVEAGIVMVARHGEPGGVKLDELLREAGIDVVSVTEAHAKLAREAYLRYGEGRHPARLNHAYPDATQGGS
ncbi:type II toxin-antitoxin system VapC family toxin [Myxococcota bacterium]|nr:type II toxin-antitoxin system VapC family toxin [Myxococcota bacterium]